MKVSIITAVYNNHGMIAKAIESVLSQQNIEIEYIVVDGKSTDGSLEVIERYRDKINVLVSGRDGGIYQALNRGLSLASGDYVGFLHSDDFYANEHVLGRLFKNINGDEAAVYGDLDYVLKHNIKKTIRHWKSSSFSPKLLKMGWMPPHPALYVRRDIFNQLNGFDVQYRIAADYHFILRLFSLSGHTFSYVPGVVVKMRTGGASNNSIKNIYYKFLEQRRILNSLGMGGGGVVIRKMLNKVHQFF
jgi:glycosyltransferase